MKQVFVLCLVALGLYGCATASPQITHLQLSAGKRQLSEHDSPVIALDAVAMPDYLLRRDLMHRTSDYKLHYDSTRRWAEPLDLAIQRVLEHRLEALLNTGQIFSFPDAPPRSPDWHLKVSVAHFEEQDRRVTLSAEGRWEQDGTSEMVVEKVLFEDAIVIATGTGEEIAAAMSELLRRFSDTLAAVLLPIDRRRDADIRTEIITQ